MLALGTWVFLGDGGPHWSLFAWGGAVIAAIVGGYMLLRYVRYRLYFAGEEPAMTVEQAEKMLEAGMISEEEFAAMRRVILGLPEKTPGTSRSPGASDDFNVDENEAGPPE